MFRSRRSGLVKRLWKCRVRSEQHEAGSQAENSTSKGSNPPSTSKGSHPTSTLTGSSTGAAEDSQLKAAMNSLLKRLKDHQLQALVAAVESGGGGGEGACVPVAVGPLQCGRRTVLPHALCCQIWRFPDLQCNVVTTSNTTAGFLGNSKGTMSNNMVTSSNSTVASDIPTSNLVTVSCNTSCCGNSSGYYGDIKLKPHPCCSNTNNNSCHGNGNSTSEQAKGGSDRNLSSTSTSTTTTPTTSTICCNPYHWSRVLEPGKAKKYFLIRVSERKMG